MKKHASERNLDSIKHFWQTGTIDNILRIVLLALHEICIQRFAARRTPSVSL
jgi:hypothetical protein